MNLKLSYASAIKLGLRKGVIDFPLETIYVMIGEKCRNSCKFCSQSITSSACSNYLSRITWQNVSDVELLNTIDKVNDIKRICLQIVSDDNSLNMLKSLVINLILVSKNNFKISISIASSNIEYLESLFEIGVDTITIPLDCAKLKTYKKFKGTDFKEKIQALVNLSQIYKGNVGTHLIYGLSDTIEDFFKMMSFLKSNSINTGLFSFTPLTGTELENLPKPDLSSYRKVQVLRALIYENVSFEPEFNSSGGLIKLNVKIEDLGRFKKLIKSGKPFLTSGCDNCTRPYYNDSPGKELYNFHRPLTDIEINKCICEFLAGLNTNLNNLI
jgi:biotin synthase